MMKSKRFVDADKDFSKAGSNIEKYTKKDSNASERDIKSS